MNTSKFATALLGGASILAVASAASAQTAAPTPAPSSEIVVTGSRVIANGNNSPTPVTVVSTDQLMEMSPSTINNALNDLPVFQGSRGQFSQPNTTGLFGGGNPATVEINLRNLAPQRTLVLFDGQRVAPTNALGVVDADMIPQELIQRVDIVTGGASAVYGSDAIAGVVNYITNTHFNGFKVDANYGISQYGDAQSWKAGLAAGTDLFGGKGHVEASYDHYDDAGLPHRNERNYYLYGLEGTVPGAAATTLGTAANPYALFNDIHSAQNTFGGLITSGGLKNQTFDSNGVLSAFNAGTPTGTANNNVGGDGSYGGLNSLEAPVRFDQVFARFDYDVTDQIHFHTEGAYNHKVDTTFSNPTAFNNQTLSSTDPYLSAVQQTALAGASTFTFSKDYSELPLIAQVSDVQNVFINSGFDGKISKYSWGLDLDYSDNVIHDAYQNNINGQHLAAALDAVVNPATGQVVCNASLTNSAYSNCVPFNPFGPTAASPGAIAYVTQTTHMVPTFTQLELAGHIGGDVFDLPAGPLNVALSAEYRRQTFTQTSDALPTQFTTCTGGIRYNCGATTATYQIAFANTVGTPSQSVKEGAIEFDAPLVKDVPFIQSFNLNGAARYTSYDYGGNAWTGKVGIDWHVDNDWTIRATMSKDIEAPTLAMLFQPLLVAFVGNQDTLTGASPNVPASNTGNPNLVSEVGYTTTAGVVWKPSFVPGFSVSADAFHIIVDGALTQIQGQAAATQQVCYASGGTSAYCALQTRPLGNVTNTSLANTVTAWVDVYENVSKIETYGADFEMNYAHRIFDRPFSIRVLTTWQPHYLFAQPGAPTYDFGNVTFPNLVPLQAVPAIQLTAIFDYQPTDQFHVNLTERWRDAMQLEPSGTGIFLENGAPAYGTTNVNFSYQIWKPGNEIYFNIQNLFNAMPTPVVGLSANSGFALTDDPTGRYFTLGFRSRF